jgi:hypothetical protein
MEDNEAAKDAILSTCHAGVASGLKRRDKNFIRDVFERHKDIISGDLSAEKLRLALADVDAPLIPDSEAAAAEVVKHFSVGNGGLNFTEFARAVATPDDMELFFREKHLPLLADALRPHVGRGHDQLQRVGLLPEGTMRAATAAVASGLRDQADAVHSELKRMFAAQLEAKEAAGKFTVFKMSSGNVTDFHSGLTGRVGTPHPNFEAAMRREHCEKAGCDVAFTSANYKITTTPQNEWRYIAGDEVGRLPVCPDMGHSRRIVPVEELLQLPLARHAKLTRPEMLAIVLYTGPMFQVYNTILRRFPHQVFTAFQEGGNTFATTIFVLVSACQKVSRSMQIPEGTLLYRGMGGLMDLPDSFHQPDACGCSGFTEWGFMSTTADYEVALGYSGLSERRPKAMVMEIEATAVDRGADISLFSQYPREKEYLWVPCSFVERLPGNRLRLEVVNGGLVTFVPVRVNANLKTETVEELQEKKKRAHIASALGMLDELRHELAEWAASAATAARLLLDYTRNKGGRSFTPATFAAAVLRQFEEVVERHKAVPATAYMDDTTFRSLVSEMLETKAWAKEKVLLWMEDVSQYISQVQDSWSLRVCHRKWQARLRQRLAAAADEPTQMSELGVQLLQSRGLVKHAVRGEVNSDGEELLVVAGGDGWPASDIFAAVAAGADIAAVDIAGRTAVHNAARFGNAHSLAALLDVGAQATVCTTDRRGFSPVWAAAASGGVECLQLLLAARADANERNIEGVAPLFIAAQKGHAACVVQLLAARCDVNILDAHGHSPMLAACMHGNAEVVSLLLAAGASIGQRVRRPSLFDDHSASHMSPLDVARQQGHAACVELLERFCAAQEEGTDLNEIAGANIADARALGSRPQNRD